MPFPLKIKPLKAIYCTLGPNGLRQAKKRSNLLRVILAREGVTPSLALIAHPGQSQSIVFLLISTLSTTQRWAAAVPSHKLTFDRTF